MEFLAEIKLYSPGYWAGNWRREEKKKRKNYCAMLTVKSPQEYYHCNCRIADTIFKSHENTNQNVYENHFHIFFMLLRMSTVLEKELEPFT